MKNRPSLIGVLAIAICMVIMPMLIADGAFAQSGGRKGGDVRTKCYNDKGKPVDCGKLNQK